VFALATNLSMTSILQSAYSCILSASPHVFKQTLTQVWSLTSGNAEQAVGILSTLLQPLQAASSSSASSSMMQLAYVN
jgi:hypothetical protein